MLDLSPAAESRLRARAEAEGVTAADLARTLLDSQLLTGDDERAEFLGENRRPMSGREALAYWRREGELGLFPEGPDSPELARDLRRQMATRNGRTTD